MTSVLMQFLPTELVHKIDQETHKVRLADVMFQNQRRYWQIQHKDTLNPTIKDEEGVEVGGRWEFEEVIEAAFDDFWGEKTSTDFGLKCGEYYWGRKALGPGETRGCPYNGHNMWEEEVVVGEPRLSADGLGEKLDKGDKRGGWMWLEYDEYILQEPHPEIIKVDCGLCCGCKWGTKCLRIKPDHRYRYVA